MISFWGKKIYVCTCMCVCIHVWVYTYTYGYITESPEESGKYIPDC